MVGSNHRSPQEKKSVSSPGKTHHSPKQARTGLSVPDFSQLTEEIKAIYFLKDRAAAEKAIAILGGSTEEKNALMEIIAAEYKKWHENAKTSAGQAENKRMQQRYFFGTYKGFTNPYEAEIIRTLHFKGTDKVAFELADGTKVYNNSADVHIIGGNFRLNLTAYDAYTKFPSHGGRPGSGADQTWRTDIGHEVWGPNAKFRVDDFVIETPGSRFGSYLLISIFNKTGNVLGQLRIAHQTRVSDAIAAGKGQIFEPGTFISIADRAIGNSTGPHSHLEATDGKTHRDVFLRWLKGV